MKLRLLLATALFGLVPPCLVAQVAQPSSPSQEGATVAYTTEIFDPQVPSLPPGYMGYDIERFYNEHVQPAKSEFETAEQYKNRLGAPGSFQTYAFRFGTVPPVKGRGRPFLKYNAEKQQFETRINFNLDSARDPTASPSDSTLVLKMDLRNETKSTMTNAFNAAVEVTNRTIDQYGLRMAAKGLPTVEVNIPLPGLRAEAVKDTLAFLAVASPATATDGTLTYSTGGVKEATFQSPSGLVYQSHYISADRLSIWAYDTVTGEVYQKIDVLKLADEKKQAEERGNKRKRW